MENDLRIQIIAVATDLFMKQGFTATSTRQIAKELNVSQPAIYHHFKNKEAIYIAVLKEFSIQVGTSLSQIVQSELESNEKLLTMAQALRDYHPMNLSLMIHDLKYSVSAAAEFEIFTFWKSNYFMPFFVFFDALSQSRELTLDAKRATQHFLRILSAYIVEPYANGTDSPANLEEVVSLFIQGITAHL